MLRAATQEQIGKSPGMNNKCFLGKKNKEKENELKVQLLPSDHYQRTDSSFDS